MNNEHTNSYAGTNDSDLFPLVEPFEEPVAGGELASFIYAIIKRYTVLDDVYVVAVTLWTMFTWLHDRATISPILNISSPEKRCGKSTLLSLLMKLCAKPLVASNITPAALFRAIERWQPTLAIDEADTFLARSEDIRGIMNAGHYRNTAFVIRCEGELNDPTRFTTWCAKIISGIGEVSETIMDRSVVITMRRKRTNEQVLSIRRAANAEFTDIQKKLARWSQDVALEFEQHIPQDVSDINDRAQDNWEPLLAIAEILGDDWPAKAHQSAIVLTGTQEEAPSIGEQLLRDIVDVFADRSDDRIRTADLIVSLCLDDEKPWATWNRGQPITPFQLSKKLKPFDIRPHNIRFGSAVKKGYFEADFSDALSRYVYEMPVTEATDATEQSDSGVTPRMPDAITDEYTRS